MVYAKREANISFHFLNSQVLNIILSQSGEQAGRNSTFCYAGKVIKDHKVAAYCQVPAQLSQYKLYNAGSLLVTFSLSSNGRTMSRRIHWHMRPKGKVLPGLRWRKKKRGKMLEPARQQFHATQHDMPGESKSILSSVENLKSHARCILADFCKMCFLQHLHKHGKTHFRKKNDCKCI